MGVKYGMSSGLVAKRLVESRSLCCGGGGGGVAQAVAAGWEHASGGARDG